jgi:hypothetical protein
MRIRDPGWKKVGSGIRDDKKSDPGSGINIPDPQHCTKLVFRYRSLSRRHLFFTSKHFSGSDSLFSVIQTLSEIDDPQP